MATDLGKAYVQIVPSAKGIGSAISSELNGEASSAGTSAGFSIAGAIKKVIIAAGIGTTIKNALEAGGNLQQSFGGLETLYGDAADAAKKYAYEAAAAGISANDYAEQAVSFGAALKAAYGDDAKAAEAANLAILDMADNSAKMGTDLASIQTAYQGFAKQNYTMLDNLKLGYGGTKSEMQRLLADATKLTGVKYDINNLGDVYSAIHAIQENLGLTGVAAQEASTTFSGSLGAMKAAGENLLANLTLGEDIGPSLQVLSKTVQTFVFGNLVPMLGNIAKGLPDLISGLSGMLIQGLNIVSNNAGEIVNVGIEIVTSLVEAIVEAAPYLIEAAFSLVEALGTALFETDWMSIGQELLTTLQGSISTAAGEILGNDFSTVEGFITGIRTFIGDAIEGGIELITNVVNGIMEALPGLITTAGELVTQFASYIVQQWPIIWQAGADLILNIVQGITSALPNITSAALTAFNTFTTEMSNVLPNILETGVNILTELVTGILEALPELITAAGQIITEFTGYVLENLPAIIDLGIQLLGNLIDGIIQTLPDIITAVAEVIAQFCATVAENLPSILEQGLTLLGEFIAGIISGIPDFLLAIGDLIETFVTAFGEYDWATLGNNIVQGIINGLKNMVDSLVEAVQELASWIWDGICDFFGIASPAKLLVWAGEMLDEGLAKGINDNADLVDDAISDLNERASAELTLAPEYGEVNASAMTTDEKLDTLLNLLTEYLPMMGQNVSVTLEGDAEGLFNAVRAQNKIYTKMNGESAFA